LEVVLLPMELLFFMGTFFVAPIFVFDLFTSGGTIAAVEVGFGTVGEIDLEVDGFVVEALVLLLVFLGGGGAMSFGFNAD